MKYNIDNKVIFDSERNTLSSLDNEGKIEEELARPTSRLLLELINQQGKLVERNDLLTRVWSDYGAIPSEGNLNNHLTFLRKRFDFWGIDRKNIETIPRKGVILKVLIIEIDDGSPPSANAINPSDDVNMQNQVFEHSLPSTTDAVPAPRPVKKNQKERIFSKKVNIYYLGLLFFLGVTTAFGIARWGLLPNDNNHHHPDEAVDIGHCHVIPTISGFIKHENEEAKKVIASFEKLINAGKFSCNEEKYVYLASRPYKDNTYIYVSDCRVTDPPYYNTCQGHTFIER